VFRHSSEALSSRVERGILPATIEASGEDPLLRSG
jgi:hypothetical protein